MVSKRMRLRLERLLDEADAAADRHDWEAVLRLANDALLIEEANEDAKAFVEQAERGSSSLRGNDPSGRKPAASTPPPNLWMSVIASLLRSLVAGIK